MKLICIGRNYGDHARELGNAIPSEPLFFLKPDSAILPPRHPFYIPSWSNEIHHEVELLIRISRNGKSIAPEFAHRYFEKVSLGIDFTARDIQQIVKEKGHPWEKAKAFDGSAVVSNQWISKSALGVPWEECRFELLKNGATVQSGSPTEMLFHVHDLIAHVSQFMTLKMGDILFTGTPAGVGAVQNGDQLEGRLEGQTMFKVHVHG